MTREADRQEVPALGVAGAVALPYLQLQRQRRWRTSPRGARLRRPRFKRLNHSKG